MQSTLLILQWHAPPRSGVDKYVLTYSGDNDEQKSVLDTLTGVFSILMQQCSLLFLAETSTTIDKGLFPGNSYHFELLAAAGDQRSDSVELNITMRPLPPVSLSVEPHFLTSNYRIRISLLGQHRTTTRACALTIQRESTDSAGTMHERNLTAKVETIDESTKELGCIFYTELIPGERYSFMARAISHNDQVILKVSLVVY